METKTELNPELKPYNYLNIPLIFSAYMSKENYEILDGIKNNIADQLLDLNEISVTNRKILHLRIDQILLDLKEIIKYRNLKGHRYNSYILRLLCVKLIYVIEVLSLDGTEPSKTICGVFVRSVQVISRILEDCYYDLKDC